MKVQHVAATHHNASPSLEWQLYDDAREWQDATQRQAAFDLPTHSVIQPARRASHLTVMIFLLLMLTASAGWLALRRARSEVAAAERAVEAEVNAEVVAELWHNRVLSAQVTPGVAPPFDPVTPLGEPSTYQTSVELYDLQREWVVVEVVIKPQMDGPSYRQTRVYQDSDYGWVRCEASPAYWGPARQFESGDCTFDYYALDEAAVVVAAPQFVTLNHALQQSMGLTDTHDACHATIDPACAPGRFEKLGKCDEFFVPSPATALVPLEMSSSDVLLQSLVLTQHVRHAEAFRRPDHTAQWHYYRVYSGHRLWFIWQHDLPLAEWRKPLVQWVFAGEDNVPVTYPITPPDFARDLCTAHRVWMVTPVELGIPIYCWDVAGVGKIASWGERYAYLGFSIDQLIYIPSADLNQLDFWLEAAAREPSPASVIIATLFEYVAATYGNEYVPQLLLAIPDHQKAETLIPALFDVSVADFSAGWRAYVGERYAIDEFRVFYNPAISQAALPR